VGFALTEENMQLSPVTEEFGLQKSHKIPGLWLKTSISGLEKA